ncbi:MAG: site-specific DNA-methyltransferase [Methanomassiliicoccales archaeon]
MNDRSTMHNFVLRDSRSRSYGVRPVHLVITSPPYPMLGMWDELFSKLDPNIQTLLHDGELNSAFELMHRQLDMVWSNMIDHLLPGGFLCINVGDALRRNGESFCLFPNHSRIQWSLFSHGLVPLPGIIWRKKPNKPNKFLGSGMLPAGAYATLEHEHILIFRKGQNREFRNEEKQRRWESALFWEERNEWYSDLWEEIPGEKQKMIAGRRAASFPVEVALRLIRMFSVYGDTVMDPFAGTGTTAIAAAAACRNSISFEVDEAYLEISERRFLASSPLLRSLCQERIEGHTAQPPHRGKRYLNKFHHFNVHSIQEREIVCPMPVSVERAGSHAYRVDYSLPV